MAEAPDLELDEAYRAAMRNALRGLRAEDVRGVLNTQEGLELQDQEKQGEEKQADLKVSYCASGPLVALVGLAGDRLKWADATASHVAGSTRFRSEVSSTFFRRGLQLQPGEANVGGLPNDADGFKRRPCFS